MEKVEWPGDRAWLEVVVGASPWKAQLRESVVNVCVGALASAKARIFPEIFKLGLVFAWYRLWRGLLGCAAALDCQSALCACGTTPLDKGV